MVGKYDVSHCGDCGSCGSDCTDCCTGAMPSIMRVTFSGVTGVYCCTAINTSYDLERVNDTCSWGGSIFGVGIESISVGIVKTGDICTLSVYAQIHACSGGFALNIFTATEDYTALDCCEFDETLPLVYSGPDGCNVTSGVVRVQGICLVECDECNDNEGPAEFQLNVSGWGDGSFCSDCDEALNGTFVLFQLGPGCTWISNYFTFCGDAFCHWQLALNSGVLTVSLVNGIGAQLWKWTWTHDGDCLNWTSVALTHSYSDPTYSGYCFGVGAVDVTAL